MAAPPATSTFILNAFESSITMDISGTIQVMNPLPSLDVSANAVYEIDLAAVKAIFTYHTDSLDVVNANDTDLIFYVHSSNTTPSGFSASPLLINPANAKVDTNYIYLDPSTSKQLVCHDFIRYLAYKLFNTHYGVDLFENEQQLQDHIRTLCNNASGHVWHNIMTVAHNAGASPQTYSTADSNICCALFRQMITTFPDRFSDIVSQCLDLDESGKPVDAAEYMLPFVDGDSLQFKLTISPADGQEELTGAASFGARSYSITLLLKESPSNPSVVDDPSDYSVV